jgi:hypothetical protein
LLLQVLLNLSLSIGLFPTIGLASSLAATLKIGRDSNFAFVALVLLFVQTHMVHSLPLENQSLENVATDKVRRNSGVIQFS